jgi:sulfatase maturation enzyme AslB (radical SAM superfamily)
MAGVSEMAPVFLTFVSVCVTIYTMPFCHAPWTNVDISPQGTILPCCKYQPQPQDPAFNIQSHSLKQYAGSAFLREIQQDFLNDRWPAGCVRCQTEEQNNISSKRQLDHERWQAHYAEYDLRSDQWLTASIAFGNTCNLKCITCGSHSSSRWHDEYLKIYSRDFQHVKFYRDDFVDDFVSQAPGIIHLDIPGGEPFLSGVPEQKKLLQHYIDSGQASDISIHYTTNVTVFPDEEWWQLWSHFREIDMQLSIDGVGVRYEYIRYPAVWNDTLDNVHRYIQQEKAIPNLRLSVSHTVSAYNIFYLDEFFTWCHDVGLPRPWLGRVHNPAHMRPTVWPCRDHVVTGLKNSAHEDVRTWAEMIAATDESQRFEEFCQRLHQHDRHRGVEFARVFPEMAPFVL